MEPPHDKPTKPWLTLGGLVLVTLIVAGFYLVIQFSAFEPRSSGAARTTTVNNGKALISFDQDYGSFPDDKTGKILAETKPGIRLEGSFSNDYLMQLIASGLLDTETVFCAKIGRDLKWGDNNIEENEAIAAKENAWTYLMKPEGVGLSTADPLCLPIIMTSLLSHDRNFLIFDRNAKIKGSAVLIQINNSAEVIDLKRSNQIPATDIFPTTVIFPQKNACKIDSLEILYPEGLSLE